MQASDHLDSLLPDHTIALAHNRRLYRQLIDQFPEEPYSLAPGTLSHTMFEATLPGVINVLQHLPTEEDLAARRKKAEADVASAYAEVRQAILDRGLPEATKPKTAKPRF